MQSPAANKVREIVRIIILPTVVFVELVNFRFRNRPEWREEVEIAASIGLADVLGIKRAVAARIFLRRLLPGGAAAGEFLVADVQMDHAFVDVDLDLVAG